MNDRELLLFPWFVAGVLVFGALFTAIHFPRFNGWCEDRLGTGDGVIFGGLVGIGLGLSLGGVLILLVFFAAERMRREPPDGERTEDRPAERPADADPRGAHGLLRQPALPFVAGEDGLRAAGELPGLPGGEFLVAHPAQRFGIERAELLPGGVAVHASQKVAGVGRHGGEDSQPAGGGKGQ